MSSFSVKMRASAGERHISGAERIVAAHDIASIVQAMTTRALGHPNGRPDAVNISLTALADTDITRVPCLPLHRTGNTTPATADNFIRRLLTDLDVRADHEVLLEKLRTVTGLRGAMLIDAMTGENLEPNRERGVRVSTMDHAIPQLSPEKQHRAEAMALASKVAAHPHILAELCISDDIDFTIGYAADATHFYSLPNIKQAGEAIGTRIFIYNGPRDEATIAETIDWLENAPVVVDGFDQLEVHIP